MTRLLALLTVVFFVVAENTVSQAQDLIECDPDTISSSESDRLFECFRLLLAERQEFALVPRDAVIAFAGTGCPTGWAEFEQASGRFIIGNDGRSEWVAGATGATYDYYDGGSAEVTIGMHHMPSHDHGLAGTSVSDHFLRRVESVVGRNEANQGIEVFSENRTVRSGEGGDSSYRFALTFQGDVDARPIPAIEEGGGQSLNIMPPFVVLHWCSPNDVQ